MADKIHYSFKALDELLRNNYTPREIGNYLDDIMSQLVMRAKDSHDYHYCEELDRHYLMLKQLRDIFWWKLSRNTTTKP
jgi:hypothetical protein